MICSRTGGAARPRLGVTAASRRSFQHKSGCSIAFKSKRPVSRIDPRGG